LTTSLVTASKQLVEQQARLDCTGVQQLTSEQLSALFAAMPSDWEMSDLRAVIVESTLSEALTKQLAAYIDARLGRTEEPPTAESSSAEEGEEEAPGRSGVELRRDLEQALINDLCGPCGGPEEIVDEPNVRGRYVVGLLAPKGQSAIPEIIDESEPLDRTSEDGTADAPPPKAASTMLPSSIGITFSVALDATHLKLTARWGHYKRVQIEDEAYRNTKDGTFRRVWQRQPIEGVSDPIPLIAGRIEPWSPCPDFPDVTVQGLARRREHQWIVTLFLVNGQEEPATNKDNAWVFQPELWVESPDGAGIFQRHAPLKTNDDREMQLMEMRYRNHVEFAVGHNVGVDWTVLADDPHCATRITTTVIPTWEVPQTTSSPPEGIDLTLDMQVLAEVPDGAFSTHLSSIVTAYEEWITTQQQRLADPTPDLQPYREPGWCALDACRTTLERIKAGITLLDTNPDAAAAFRFANRAMALQRVRGLYAAAVRRGETPDLDALDVPDNHSWRMFQLGFVLLNLPGLTDLHHIERAQPLDPAVAYPDSNIVDLLWFPTGGGKTEAYLGLAAYTMAIRRLQGTIAGHSGHAGVAVLMRYTLRLLTLQQFQRAAALLCACEVIRREEVGRWGDEPFRIGLWVGQNSTPNRIKDAEEAIKQLKKNSYAGAGVGIGVGIGSPHQLTFCPWCGTPITPDLIMPEPAERGRARIITYCGDSLGRCPFSHKQAPGEGVPVMVVDEEIYRRLPSLLIATVDKFAQMPWNGRIAALFGRVDGYCERHGYHTPDTNDRSNHQANKKYGLPAARFLEEIEPLRPPDLIIQDELHLINGPLGTLVGLYETAVDTLATWEVDGKRVRPKVIASTATIRRAHEQVHNLFARKVHIFPPQGLDVDDTFFANQRPISEKHPGRRYVGICTPGIRHKSALIQTAIALLAAAQQLYEQDKENADPWMTLVGYFNSLRELAAMRRAVDDTVSTRLKKMDRRGLAKRVLDLHSVKELTSRLSASDIPNILDQLETPFDPAVKRTAKTAKRRKKAARESTSSPVDVLLATNMISVGVDVGRLGLMLVDRQPKATAEYIQATSRVGRLHPGLICTVYNWAHPRDLSHYERFRHYHSTFYQHVEALSVTPFSPRALDRGLSALLVSLIRLREPAFNPNDGAGNVTRQHPAVQTALGQITARADHITTTENVGQVEQALTQRMDFWQKRVERTIGAILGYKAHKDGTTVKLLQVPEGTTWDLFTCLNSLRDVEPTVNLVLDDTSMDDGIGQPWIFDSQSAPAVVDQTDVTTEDE
jgi:hypothetical protein